MLLDTVVIIMFQLNAVVARYCSSHIMLQLVTVTYHPVVCGGCCWWFCCDDVVAIGLVVCVGYIACVTAGVGAVAGGGVVAVVGGGGVVGVVVVFVVVVGRGQDLLVVAWNYS